MSYSTSTTSSNYRSFRLLLSTHVIVFVAGFTAGKLIDYDELKQYRSSNESYVTRIRRHVTTLCVGIVSIGTIAIIAKLMLAPSKKIERLE